MKKGIAIAALAAVLTLSGAGTALARGKDRDNDSLLRNRIKASALFKSDFKSEARKSDAGNKVWGLAENKFVLVGTVSAKTDANLTITATGSANVPNISNNVATVGIDADTNFELKDREDTLAALAVGDRVLIRGSVDGAVVTATHVHLIGEVDKAKRGKAMGEITAVSDTSVTIQNSLTGESQTVVVNEDTKVRVNGEVKTTADLEVGDKGVVKFKVLVDSVVAKFIGIFR